MAVVVDMVRVVIIILYLGGHSDFFLKERRSKQYCSLAIINSTIIIGNTVGFMKLRIPIDIKTNKKSANVKYKLMF